MAKQKPIKNGLNNEEDEEGDEVEATPWFRIAVDEEKEDDGNRWRRRENTR